MVLENFGTVSKSRRLLWGKSRLVGAFSVSESLIFFPQGLGVPDAFVKNLEISEFCLIKLVFI